MIERASPAKPQFETDTVSIEYFTTEPEGITVQTRQNLGRAALAEEFGKPSLSAEQAAHYGNALRGEAKFQKLDEYATVRDQHGWNSPEAKEAWREYRQRLAHTKKIGLRSTSFDPSSNTLTVDVTNVAFPTYKEFAKPDSSPELRAYAEATGNAMVIVTKDNKLVVQHRAIEKPHMLTGGKARGNALYTDIPGVSVAGMYDATPSERPGVPDKIDNASITASIMKEAGEELGLSPEHLKDVRIVGVAKDKTQPHDEFLFLAETDMTSAELNETSRNSKRNKNLGDLDFEEKFLTIEATPAAIRTLLVDVRCPLPPTHSAAMVVAGYSMVLEQQGTVAADAWRTELQNAMNQNAQSINRTVANYYERFPEAAAHVPERFWGKSAPKRNLEGYSPAYGPEEQGLPSLEDELVRTGLKPETRREVKHAHLFDVDGVLSDPHDKKVIHDELFDEIITRLQDGEPVCLNTGRSADWVLNNVVTHVIDRLGDDKQSLELLSVVGEKGGSWVTYDAQGNMHKDYAPSLQLPETLLSEVSDLIASDPEYSAMMTTKVDALKRTMISPEMSSVPEGVSRSEHLARFQRAQDRFAVQAQQLLEKAGLAHLFKVDKTTIATDIESPYVGKDLGADRFLEIMKAQDLNFRADNGAEFTTYGDSPSDIAMAEELERRGLDVDFVYVGNGTVEQRPGYTFPIHSVHNYTDGTLAYLRANRG